MHQELARGPFLVLLNNPKRTLDKRNCLKQDVLKKEHKKALEKLISFFILNQSLLIEKVITNKRGAELVTS